MCVSLYRNWWSQSEFYHFSPAHTWMWQAVSRASSEHRQEISLQMADFLRWCHLRHLSLPIEAMFPEGKRHEGKIDASCPFMVKFFMKKRCVEDGSMHWKKQCLTIKTSSSFGETSKCTGSDGWVERTKVNWKGLEMLDNQSFCGRKVGKENGEPHS